MVKKNTMSDNKAEKAEKNNINRRRVLRGIGTTAGFTTVGAASQTTADANTDTDPQIREVSGSKRKRVVNLVESDPDYSLLVEYLIEGDKFTVDNSDIAVYENITEETPRYVTSIPVVASQNRDWEKVNKSIAASVTTGNDVELIGYIVKKEGDRVSVTQISVRGNSLVKKSDEFTKDMLIPVDGVTVAESANCSACRSVARVACDLHCVVAPGAICTIVGGVYAGTACAALAEFVCSALHQMREIQGQSPCHMQRAAWEICEYGSDSPC